MTLFDRGIRGAAGVLAVLALLSPVGAQENLDHGKSAAQLFASDCAMCHKSPAGLGKSGGLFGLDSFLREHYTASRETAAALSKYLQAVADAPAPATRSKRTTRRPDNDKAKAAVKKPAGDKADSKPETSSDAKPEPKAEPKSEAATDTKPEAKPVSSPAPKSEPKMDAKPAEAKPAEDKPAEAKPAASKPESKPE
jgi:hypothetical protein